MIQTSNIDPRIIANALLDFAWRYDVEVTHLKLQKTIYFLHGKYLKEFKKPLVSGYFEAWKHGPVHPQLWVSFKEAGNKPIRHHAYGVDIFSGAAKKLDELEDSKVSLFIATRSIEFLEMEAFRLVGLSHTRNSPWDVLTKKEDGERVYGGRITNELIEERFRFHVMGINKDHYSGEEIDEQPPA